MHTSTSTSASLLLLTLLSTSSALPTFSSTITLSLPWHPPPPPNSDLRLHKPRMQMPDSPHPPPHTSFDLGAQLPVSYRVAIAVDAVVLLVTILSLIGLGVYIRRQIRRRRDGLLQNQEEGYGFESDDASSGDEDEDGKGDIALGDDGKVGEAGVGEMGRKKKGHVRWTSSVVGMGVFARMSVDEGRLKLEGGEGNKGWKYEARRARMGAPFEVRGAPGFGGVRGN
ncbi:hypothetical protein V8E51_007132 [Hyaloscypha variabilis]